MASLNRIYFPESYGEGIIAGRKAAVGGAIASITAPDDYTVLVKLGDVRSPELIMEAISNGFNVITSKEALDAAGGDLKGVDTYPGTGPYKHHSRDSEKWVQQRFADYWNDDAGFLDQWTHVWMRAYSAEMTAALDGGVVDIADYVAPKGWNAFKKRPEARGFAIYSPGNHIIVFNTQNPPLDDPKVREAFALALDGPKLVEAFSELQQVRYVDWFHTGTDLARTSAEIAQIPHLRSPTADDIAMAKQLLAEAGYPDCEGMPSLDAPTRDVPDARAVVPAIQAMLKQNLGCDSNTQIVQTSEMGQKLRDGEYHITRAWFGGGMFAFSASAQSLTCGSANNISQYCNPEFDALVAAYAGETDPAKGLELRRQLRGVLEMDWPFEPAGETAILWGWYDHVGGMPDFDPTTFEKNLHKLDWIWSKK